MLITLCMRLSDSCSTFPWPFPTESSRASPILFQRKYNTDIARRINYKFHSPPQHRTRTPTLQLMSTNRNKRRENSSNPNFKRYNCISNANPAVHYKSSKFTLTFATLLAMLLAICILPSTPRSAEKYRGVGNIPAGHYVVVMRVMSLLQSYEVFLSGHNARFFSCCPPFAVF